MKENMWRNGGFCEILHALVLTSGTWLVRVFFKYDAIKTLYVYKEVTSNLTLTVTTHFVCNDKKTSQNDTTEPDCDSENNWESHSSFYKKTAYVGKTEIIWEGSL